MGAQADDHVGTEKLAGEVGEGSFQVGQRDAGIDRQALDLVEHRKMGSIDGVGPVRLSRHHDVDGRFVRLHVTGLHRRGLGPQRISSAGSPKSR